MKIALALLFLLPPPAAQAATDFTTCRAERRAWEDWELEFAASKRALFAHERELNHLHHALRAAGKNEEQRRLVYGELLMQEAETAGLETRKEEAERRRNAAQFQLEGCEQGGTVAAEDPLKGDEPASAEWSSSGDTPREPDFE